MSQQTIGILGGTFDPIHFGHLRLALEIQQILRLDSVRLVPCHNPVHKNGLEATPEQRLAMLTLAIQDEPTLICDDREIRRDGPSYMVDTLESLRQEIDTPLCMIVGSDAFLKLDDWHRWEELLSLSHIIVATRPGVTFDPNPAITRILRQHQLDYPEGLHENSAGYVYLQTISALDIAATTIRGLIQAGYSARYLLPDNVLDYIQQHNLYSGL
ncbi:MAG: nicotinic acid mononucleotide adenylyltransferase [Legionellales bacterium]|nr:nicotinic acid mononucleotide adenylyltransferase [Legionellales bacterium]|tara:strand:- start:57381 stop:58022 length:642 start_codon:yes stop_codon:yes gene_type:complete